MNNNIIRETMVKLATLVKPALSSQGYIQALTHIRFDGEFATAFNDVTAIMVRCDFDIKGCLPGERLMQTLGSFATETIACTDKDGTLIMSSGRAKMKLPMLPVKDFPFTLPDLACIDEIPLDHAVMQGIERCLLSVGKDTTHPATLGVTLDELDGRAILFSTDNVTASRFQTQTKIALPGQAPIILPTFFCQQLIALAKAFPKEPIYMLPVGTAIVVEFGQVARLFTKTLVDVEPMDFPKIFAKHAQLDTLSERLCLIPDTWDAAFARAVIVLSGEVAKATKVTVTADQIKLASTSDLGTADDSMFYEIIDGVPPSFPEDSFYIDPMLVLRVSKVCGYLTWGQRALVLVDQLDTQFVHLITYTSK